MTELSTGPRRNVPTQKSSEESTLGTLVKMGNAFVQGADASRRRTAASVADFALEPVATIKNAASGLNDLRLKTATGVVDAVMEPRQTAERAGSAIRNMYSQAVTATVDAALNPVETARAAGDATFTAATVFATGAAGKVALNAAANGVKVIKALPAAFETNATAAAKATEAIRKAEEAAKLKRLADLNGAAVARNKPLVPKPTPKLTPQERTVAAVEKAQQQGKLGKPVDSTPMTPGDADRLAARNERGVVRDQIRKAVRNAKNPKPTATPEVKPTKTQLTAEDLQARNQAAGQKAAAAREQAEAQKKVKEAVERGQKRMKRGEVLPDHPDAAFYKVVKPTPTHAEVQEAVNLAQKGAAANAERAANHGRTADFDYATTRGKQAAASKTHVGRDGMIEVPQGELESFKRGSK